MTDRGRTSMEGSPACPFIAYEDERDERSSEPDHAHRCYAEVRPAPRALAHQEAYCLSSAFPVCPTFQAWARREAAQARSVAAASAASASAASASASVAAAASSGSGGASHEDPHEPDDRTVGDQDDLDLDPDGLPARRNPPRDWAAPPPWAGGAAGAAAMNTAGGRPSSGATPEFLASRSSEGQGLAGSAADRLASGEDVSTARPASPPMPSSAPSAPPDPELAGLVGGSSQSWSSSAPVESSEPPPPSRPVKRPPVSSTRDRNVDRGPVQTGPAWEKARRYEAYPTIKTRTGMPDIPRVLLLAGALGVAALAVFFLPALLGLGGKDAGSPSASPSPSAAIQSAEPSVAASPSSSSTVYIVKSGDTFTKIAKKNGVTVEELKAANPSIKDINKISVGDEIIIPTPTPSDFVDPSAAASP
jgi:nucleoid-associated protein YgaU